MYFILGPCQLVKSRMNFLLNFEAKSKQVRNFQPQVKLTGIYLLVNVKCSCFYA